MKNATNFGFCNQYWFLQRILYVFLKTRRKLVVFSKTRTKLVAFLKTRTKLVAFLKTSTKLVVFSKMQPKNATNFLRVFKKRGTPGRELIPLNCNLCPLDGSTIFSSLKISQVWFSSAEWTPEPSSGNKTLQHRALTCALTNWATGTMAKVACCSELFEL